MAFGAKLIEELKGYGGFLKAQTYAKASILAARTGEDALGAINMGIAHHVDYFAGAGWKRNLLRSTLHGAAGYGAYRAVMFPLRRGYNLATYGSFRNPKVDYSAGRDAVGSAARVGLGAGLVYGGAWATMKMATRMFR